MRGGTSLVVGALLLVCWGGTPCPAQPPAPDGAAVAAQLRALNGKLERLITLLERFEQYRETELLIKRIDLLQSRIAPRESSLRGAEEALVHLNDRRVRIETMLNSAREAREDALRAGEVETADALRNEIAELERAFGNARTERDSVELRVRRLEDELAESRELLEDLDALLLERLE